MSRFYESDRALSEYLLFHYGSGRDILPWPFGPRRALDYPVRCITRFLGRLRVGRDRRALDLGCAVGRSCFELARHCGEVIGIDSSRRFIECAERLRSEGRVPFRYEVRGQQEALSCARVPQGIDRDRVRFEEGDALHLRQGLGTFDVVLMANLIDRLEDPGRCLERMADLVRPGGHLVVSSPYTWREEFTPREHWLERQPAQVIRKLLGPAFAMRERDDLPFLIREHERKYQWSVAEATLWERME